MADSKMYQSWNKRSKHWTLFENGKFKSNSREKFEGIPVKTGKPESSPEPEKPADNEPKKKQSKEESQTTDPPEKKDIDEPLGFII